LGFGVWGLGLGFGVLYDLECDSKFYKMKLDTGLCAYLTKRPTPDTLMMGAMAGAILETYVIGIKPERIPISREVVSIPVWEI